ncbi:MAG: hypothetical protein M3R53_06180 [Candidatus Eremiobacteraeota bacterium]|nr:hypothetical protein [Candidatus Eremiobacteraeota bacterium]
MATPDIIPDPNHINAGDAAGTFRVDGASVDWTYDGPTLFLSEPAGDVTSFERLFKFADIFARGHFALALVLRLASGDERLDACRELGFEDAAGIEFDGYISLVRDVG